MGIASYGLSACSMEQVFVALNEEHSDVSTEGKYSVCVRACVCACMRVYVNGVCVDMCIYNCHMICNELLLCV